MSAYPFLSGNPIGTWNWQLFGILQTGVNPNGTLKYVNRRFDVTSLLSRNYHTGTQPASTITEDASHRFATDAEKIAWSNKQAALVSGTNIKTVNNQALTGPGNINIAGGGFDTANQQVYNAVKKIAQDNAISVDYQFDRLSFDTLAGGGLDLWGHNRYPSFSTPVTNLTINLSGTSSYQSGVIVLNTGSSTATIAAKGTFAVFNFVPNWPVTPASVTYSVEGDDSDTYFGTNRVYTKSISASSLNVALGAGATLPANKPFYIHYKITPGSNASGQ